MQNKNTYSDLLKSIYTLEDADLLINELEQLSHDKFIVNEKLHLSTFSFLKKLNLSPENLDDATVSRLIAGLKKAPVVKIEIGFPPRSLTITKIGQWIKRNVGSEALFSLSVSSEIIGGASISFNGKISCSTLIKA